MRTTKRTYSLTPETVNRFEEKVTAGQRSTTVNQILDEWLAAKEDEEMRQLLIEGCEEMAEIYLELERDFHPLEEEVDRALNA